MTTQPTIFGNAIQFLDKLGVYNVVLPFLLVFTIVFAILEKTRILGTEGKEGTKKNLNAIAAFVIAFLVVASTSLVAAINQIMANVVLIVVLMVSFLMLVGIMYGTGEFNLKEHKAWATFFMVVIFIAIAGITANALGWLKALVELYNNNSNTDYASTIVLLVIIIAFMIFVTRDNKAGGDEKKKEEKAH